MIIRVRELDLKNDTAAVEDLERRCETTASTGKMSLFTHLLGDPICRIRHSPSFLMLVRLFSLSLSLSLSLKILCTYVTFSTYYMCFSILGYV